MKYIIIYNNNQNYNYASNRSDLLHWLKILKDEQINDIRKIYKSGISDSVITIVYRIQLLHISKCIVGGIFL